MKQLEAVERDAIERVVEQALAEDVGAGDVTSLGTVPEDATCTARIVVKEQGVVAGIPVVRAVFESLDPTLVIEETASDGDVADQLPYEIVRVAGSARSVLAAERVALNLLGAGAGITNDGFSQLAKQEPEGLSLNATALTDDGFKALASMKSLKVLNILHTVRVKDGFTGAGFAQLKSLPKLYKVSFAGSSAREPAFVALGELTQLTEFHSWHSEYGDPTNPYLLNFKNLETLRMGNSLKRNDGTPRQLSLSDVTLSTIAQLSNLKTLTLMEAKFSLPALMQLKSLPKLKTLIFVNVDISEADFEKLRSALPNVKVTGKPLDEAARTKLSVFLK